MNNLQKINGLLAKDGRTIVYGVPAAVADDSVIAIGIGEGDAAVGSLRERGRIVYTTVDISVYAADYIAGYDLLLAVKNEIEAAVKSTVKIVFQRFCESKYNTELQKHVLKSQYKIIE